ncbi:chaperonin 10-like protein [Pyrenochaeta sp. MPI-SDFR-AT-0127]|nr:chaperonin 10-like protein [Pyrenochaeta sp. MPI-SDFR-AT-0127]
MKAIVISQAGATPEIRDDVEVPEPGEGQILVKTLYTAVNPVYDIQPFLSPSDTMMSAYGALVSSWPFTPGCDVSGVVVKTGSNATSPLGGAFKEGDHVFTCSRLGVKGHTAWGEYLLLDAPVTIPKPSNISLAQASATGVGIFTAALGIFGKLGIPLPDSAAPSQQRNEWALVFGGAGSVGQFSVQLLKISGFKVVTTCSTKSFDLLRSIGADVTVDYKLTSTEIVGQIHRITGGELNYAFDAVSVNNALLTELYAELARPPHANTRFYTTTNDFDALPTSTPSNPFTANSIQLGPIGKPEATELNAQLNSYIPVLYKLLESGALKTSEYSVEGEGFEGILKAWDVQKSGVKGSVKVVAKVADE